MRNQGIDTFRVLAILAVLAIHTEPFQEPQFQGTAWAFLGELIPLLCRFAVPFFFVASGYFVGLKLLKSPPDPRAPLRQAWKCLTLFLVWSAIYILLLPLLVGIKNRSLGAMEHSLGAVLRPLAAQPWKALLEGGTEMLWFLMALAIAQFLVFLLAGRMRALMGLAILLFLICLLGGSYANLPVGFRLPFMTRDGPFAATLFVALGVWLARRPPPGWKVAIVLTVGGLALTLIEAAALKQVYDFPPRWHEFLIGTVPLAVGLFLIALNSPALGDRTPLPAWGRYTLGVYAIHMLIYRVAWPGRSVVPPVPWQMLFPLLVYAGSLVAVWLLSRLRWTKPYVA